jgi:hypothetical protein
MSKINVESSGELYWEFWDGGKVPLYTIKECDIPQMRMNDEPWLPVIFPDDPSQIGIVWRLPQASPGGVTEQRLRDVIMTYTRSKTSNELNPNGITPKQEAFENLNHLHLGYVHSDEAAEDKHPYPLYFLFSAPSPERVSSFQRATIELVKEVLGKDDPHAVGGAHELMKRHSHPCC